MSNLLLVSNHQSFLEDLSGQIMLYASEYTVNAPNAIPDIILLDEETEQLRSLQQKYPQTPIFVFLPKGSEKPEASTFVHYEIKPLLLTGLINYLHSAVNLAFNSDAGKIKFNCYELKPLSKEILNLNNNQMTKLTEKEVAVIQYLYKIKNRIVSKTELLQEVWGYSPDVTTHTIETHIYRLRQKVEQNDSDSQLIITEDGGYLLKR